MKIKIIEEKCIGCGICESQYPECFKVESGLAKVQESCDKDCDCNLEEAIKSCPSEAIVSEN